MSWRWRKSLAQGPFKLNLSRSGVGWSINLGLFRYGITPEGRRYVGAGIPGTGIYFYKQLPSAADHNTTIERLLSEGAPEHPVASQQQRPRNNQVVLDRIRRCWRSSSN